MDINYTAILACGVFAVVLGFIWYGTLFGKMWMKVIGATNIDVARRKEMQKQMIPLMFAQFVLVLFQVYVLAHFIQGWTSVSGVESSLWIWAAFIVPTVAASSMWNNDSAKIAWTRFLLQSAYYLVLFVSFGYILESWG